MSETITIWPKCTQYCSGYHLHCYSAVLFDACCVLFPGTARTRQRSLDLLTQACWKTSKVIMWVKSAVKLRLPLRTKKWLGFKLCIASSWFWTFGFWVLVCWRSLMESFVSYVYFYGTCHWYWSRITCFWLVHVLFYHFDSNCPWKVVHIIITVRRIHSFLSFSTARTGVKPQFYSWSTNKMCWLVVLCVVGDFFFFGVVPLCDDNHRTRRGTNWEHKAWGCLV